MTTAILNSTYLHLHIHPSLKYPFTRPLQPQTTPDPRKVYVSQAPHLHLAGRDERVGPATPAAVIAWRDES